MKEHYRVLLGIFLVFLSIGMLLGLADDAEAAFTIEQSCEAQTQSEQTVQPIGVCSRFRSCFLLQKPRSDPDPRADGI